MLDFKSKNINETWNEISADNSTDCEMVEAITMTTQYGIAGKIMEYILIFNLVSYIIGIMISNPAWIDQIIEKNSKFLKDYHRIQKLKDGNYVTTIDEIIIYEELKSKLTEIERKLIRLKVFRYFAKLFWPFLIVIPHEYLTGIKWCIFYVIFILV